MYEQVRELIDKIYFKNKYDYFIEKSKNKIELPSNLIKYLEDSKFEVDDEDDINDPEKVYYIDFNSVINGEFQAKFYSKLRISKITKVFYIQHEFEVQNKDKFKIEPTLDGFSDVAYNKLQYDFEKKVCYILENDGYKRLYYVDLLEVIEGLKMPEDVKLFGPQVTVETALFRDVFELVPDEES